LIYPFQGMAPRIGERVFIAPSATVLGDVDIGDDVSIWFNCVLRGDVNAMTIGARSNIQDLCCLHVTNQRWPLRVEEEVSVAHNVMLHGCTLRKGALVGMSTTIMDGAEVGEGGRLTPQGGLQGPAAHPGGGLAGPGEGPPLPGPAGPGGGRMAPLHPLQGSLLQGRLGHGGGAEMPVPGTWLRRRAPFPLTPARPAPAGRNISSGPRGRVCG
jgi:carbonic anhydrase/acetyltransferase-like protein (isoleucine patch superfamily)